MAVTILSFTEAVGLAAKVGVVKEEDRHDPVETVLFLGDGSELHFRSSYEEDYSDTTPGDGIQLPEVYLMTPKANQ